MARSFSEDLRVRFLQAVANGASARAAGKRFAIAPTTAIRWARVWRETGERRAKPRGRPVGGGRLAAHEGFLLTLYEEQADITLHEMAARLAKARRVVVHPATLWRFFNQRGITWKKDHARGRAPARAGERPALGVVRAAAGPGARAIGLC